MSIGSVMPSNHLILCRPLLLLTSLFPSIRVFLSEFFTLGGQRIGVSASASVLPVNIQDLFPLGLTGLISLKSMGLSRVFSNTIQKHHFFNTQASLWSSSHICTCLLKKTIALTIWTCVGNRMSLLSNMLSRFVIAFLSRSKDLLISWLQSPSAVISEPKKSSVSLFPLFPPFICHEVMRPDAKILVF